MAVIGPFPLTVKHSIMFVEYKDRFVKLPNMEEEWRVKVEGFLENYEFPCVGAWDGIHVYISFKLKNYFSLKRRYSISNMGLTGFNKSFLYAAVGASGSTHDARLTLHIFI